MFSIIIPFLDLDQTFDSAQSLRWIKLKDKKYVIVYNNEVVKVEQHKERFLFSCSEEKFFNVWFNYFDLSTDYSKINYKLKNIDKYLKIVSNRTKGIRLIKQSLFESILLSIILNEQKDFELARIKLNFICRECGKKHTQMMGEAKHINWFETPTPEEILQNENKLKQNKISIDCIKNVCNLIIDNTLNLEEIKEMKPKQAYNKLCEFLPQNVAKMICVFGLHFLNVSFEFDLLEKVIKKEYYLNWNDFKSWVLEDIKEKSIIEQYFLYHILNLPKDLKKEVL